VHEIFCAYSAHTPVGAPIAAQGDQSPQCAYLLECGVQPRLLLTHRLQDKNCLILQDLPLNLAFCYHRVLQHEDPP